MTLYEVPSHYICVACGRPALFVTPKHTPPGVAHIKCVNPVCPDREQVGVVHFRQVTPEKGHS